jgi:hypothetical protein
MSRLKNIVLFLKIITQFMLLRCSRNIFHDLAKSSQAGLTVHILRKLEKYHIKSNKARLDINFLKNCKSFNVYPKYLGFNIPHANYNDIISIKKRLLKSALNKRINEKKLLDKELENLKSQVRKNSSSLQWYLLTKTINNNIKKKELSIITTHEKKLRSLTKSTSIPFKHQNVIKNISSYSLQHDELDLLNNGLGFALPPVSIKKTDVFAQFDSISQFLNTQLKNNDSKPQIKSELSHLANNYVYKYTPSESCLRKHKILKRLRKNENIIITRPDKGNGIIVLNKVDYINSLHNIISNKTKFKELKEDPTIKRELSLQGYLRKLNKLKCFEKDIYSKIYPVGSQAARIYALPKMHKVNNDNSLPTFRPIISTIGTYNYNLAKHLSHLLSPHIPKQFCTLDSFSFVEELKQINVKNKFVVSYDVESLFTNIPLNEAINIATDLFFKDKVCSKHFSKTQFKKLLQISTSGSHFLFNGKYYDQTDGVAMGSPLAPILANIFIGFHEQTWVLNCSSSPPIFYKRYVDDIIAIFNSEYEAQEFFKHLNKQHENLKFTMEKEQDNQIAFLDVLIQKCITFSTSVYHKKTYTGLLQNYFSFAPFSYKISLIRCLIDRTFKINNTWLGFDKDIKNLSLVLQNNQFPQKIIDSEIKSYIDKKMNPLMSNTVNDLNIRYFKLPFIGIYSNYTKMKINKIIHKYCKDILIKLIFTTNKIQNSFCLKEPLPKLLKSHVVYKFTCASCNASYIGETSRHLTTRINEHLRSDKQSHVYKHLNLSLNCKDLNNCDSFQVLDTAPTKYKLKIKEALHIKWENPTLNKQNHHYNINLSL